MSDEVYTCRGISAFIARRALEMSAEDGRRRLTSGSGEKLTAREARIAYHLDCMKALLFPDGGHLTMKDAENSLIAMAASEKLQDRVLPLLHAVRDEMEDASPNELAVLVRKEEPLLKELEKTGWHDDEEDRER